MIGWASVTVNRQNVGILLTGLEPFPSLLGSANILLTGHFSLCAEEEPQERLLAPEIFAVAGSKQRHQWKVECLLAALLDANPD